MLKHCDFGQSYSFFCLRNKRLWTFSYPAYDVQFIRYSCLTIIFTFQDCLVRR